MSHLFRASRSEALMGLSSEGDSNEKKRSVTADIVVRIDVDVPVSVKVWRRDWGSTL
jgi:hypothetical protein